MATLLTDINQLDLQASYTYADYLLWRFEERLELIKGKIFQMSPAPSTRHQQISGRLYLEMGSFFKQHHCQIFYAPFDVRLSKTESSSANNKIHTVVQPDLCVVCDQNKLDERGCLGAPDLVIEILSPGNSRRELNDKFALYEESGVREYWLVEPTENAVFVYVLNENNVYIGLQPATDTLRSVLFPDLVIDLHEVFQ